MWRIDAEWVPRRVFEVVSVVVSLSAVAVTVVVSLSLCAPEEALGKGLGMEISKGQGEEAQDEEPRLGSARKSAHPQKAPPAEKGGKSLDAAVGESVEFQCLENAQVDETLGKRVEEEHLETRHPKGLKKQV